LSQTLNINITAFTIRHSNIQNSDEKFSQGNKSPQFKLLLVIDTNIFLSHLKHLIELKEKYPNEIVVSVPWVVLQELDYIKSQTGSNIGQRAREAISFISDLLNDTNANGFIFENSVQVC
jgi:hypothetical protein